MNCFQSQRRKNLVLALFAALAGGSTFTSCDTRMKTAVVGGTKNFVFTIFDPSVWFPDLFPQSNSAAGAIQP